MNQYILRSVCVELGFHNISGNISSNSRITFYRSLRGVDENGEEVDGFQAYALTEKNLRRAMKMQMMVFEMTAPAPLPVDVDESVTETQPAPKNDMVLTVAGWITREAWDAHAERIWCDNNQLDNENTTFVIGLDDAREMLARDDHNEMAMWLTAQIGESVMHHPIENLRIFMERQIRKLEAGL